MFLILLVLDEERLHVQRFIRYLSDSIRATFCEIAPVIRGPPLSDFYLPHNVFLRVTVGSATGQIFFRFVIRPGFLNWLRNFIRLVYVVYL